MAAYIFCSMCYFQQHILVMVIVDMPFIKIVAFVTLDIIIIVKIVAQFIVNSIIFKSFNTKRILQSKFSFNFLIHHILQN